MEVSSDGLIDILSFAWVTEKNNENHSIQSVLLLRLKPLIAEYKPEIFSLGPTCSCFNVKIIGTQNMCVYTMIWSKKYSWGDSVFLWCLKCSCAVRFAAEDVFF